MLKIIDIHLSASAAGEYVVLQNQGLTTVSLKGWAVCSNAYFDGSPLDAAHEMYIFTDDIPIKPYMRIVLFTGEGDPGWCPTVDGKYAYLVYWGKRNPIWSRAGYVHLLQVSTSRKVVQPEEAGLARV